jgi:hypothetical protein
LISETPIIPSPSANDPLWTTPVPSSYVYQFSNTADGTKTIYAWFKDEVGNVSTQISDEIILDTTPPQGTITIELYRGILSGAVAYWKFDEGSGNTTSDLTTNANDGTIAGASWTTGKFGNTLDFNGSSDYVDHGNDSSMNAGSAISIAAWIKPDTAGDRNYGRIISKYGSSSGWDLFLGDGGGNKLILKINGTNLWSEAGSLVGAWHHVVVVYESGVGATFYVDGVSAGTDSNYTDPVNSNSSNVQIGKWPISSSRYFDGLIDEVIIYHRALSESEITNLYNLDITLQESVAYWKFDEGSGSTTSDVTANVNDGTINGANWTTSGKSGNALSFNGNSDYVDIENDASLNPTVAITIEAWVNPNTAGQVNYGRIISKYGSSSGWDLFLGDGGGNKLILKINGTNLWSEAGSLVGAWHHVVVVYESGVGATFYVDGVSAGTASNYTDPIDSNSSNVQIGKWPISSGRYFDGFIDEVVIYNRALNATEVQGRYNSF